MPSLRPLRNNVLFEFLDQTGGAQGKFTERTRSGLIIPNLQSTQKDHRWGKVLAVGPEAETDGIKVGDFILIEALMWTNHEVFEGEKLWKTDTSKIMCVTDDESQTVTY